MATINKKVWSEYFEQIISGKKKLELRLADFEVNEGDTLILEEWDKDKKEYTGRKVEVVVTYILKTKSQTFWSPEEVEKHGFQIIQFELKDVSVQRPKVGIGVMIMKDGKVLLGKRRSSHGAGEFAWPGGHLEFGESFEGCAKRETMEEAGIKITNVRFLRLMNLKRYANKHYVDLGLIADWESGEPKAKEPEKCEGWAWYDMNNLPQPLFATIPTFIEAHKTGKNYFDLE